MPKITLRPAKKDDARLIFAWRNEAVARFMSESSKSIAFDDHEIWFNDFLLHEEKEIFIGLYGGKPCGYVRLEYEQVGADKKIAGEQSYCLMSWNVDHDYRGLGIAKAMTAQVTEGLDVPLVAIIKPQNTASIQIAKSIGMHHHSTKRDLLYYKRHGWL